MDFVRTWIRNLFTGLLVAVVVCVVMLIFTKLFYPDALSLLLLTGQFTVGMVNILKLWLLVILAIIINAIPRRRSKNIENRTLWGVQRL
jgi:hypothetical protein